MDTIIHDSSSLSPDMYRAIIIEDEPQAIKLLQHHMERISTLDIVATYRDPEQALRELSEHEVDLLFLDINMPKVTGLQLLQRLENTPSVIFTTAYPEHAHTAFDLDAVDYLLKPITYERLERAYQKFLNRKKSSVHQSSDIVSPIKKDLIYVKSGTTIHQLDWREILYIKRDENYVCFFLKKKKVLSRRSLGSLEEVFPSYIHRIHKSYAISMLHLTEIHSHSVVIDAQTIPIGRSYREDFVQRIKLL